MAENPRSRIPVPIQRNVQRQNRTLAELRIINEIREFRVVVNARLDGVDGRLDGVDGRLDGVNARLDGVDGRLDGVDGRLDGVNARLDPFILEQQGINETATARLNGIEARCFRGLGGGAAVNEQPNYGGNEVQLEEVGGVRISPGSSLEVNLSGGSGSTNTTTSGSASPRLIVRSCCCSKKKLLTKKPKKRLYPGAFVFKPNKLKTLFRNMHVSVRCENVSEAGENEGKKRVVSVQFIKELAKCPFGTIIYEMGHSFVHSPVCEEMLFLKRILWFAGALNKSILLHDDFDFGKLGTLELTGTPLHSNFVSILDFQKKQVALLVMSLPQQQQNRQMFGCFLVGLEDELLKSAKAGTSKLNQLHGCEHKCQFIGILGQSSFFDPEIVGECKDARLVYLSKICGGEQNSESFDACLSDEGIQKDVVRDENYLNILRQICFFIPEWRPFAQQALFGGQQRGQTFDLLNNQQQSTTSKTTLNFVPTDTTTPCSVSLMDFRM
uniref:Uncharacterized protein n=1 Tax=Meloidogyne incognita TaxID=6306 RepID=A0A914MZB5_MELIC